MTESTNLAVIDTMQPLSNLHHLMTSLDKVRVELGNGLMKTGELLGKYAHTMTEAFGAEWWAATGETKKLVKAEHDKFISMAETKLKWSRSQIDVYWSRVKDAAGRVKAQNKVKAALDIDAVTAKELTTMLNRILGAEPETCPKSQLAKKYLLDAATALGIDTAQDLKH